MHQKASPGITIKNRIILALPPKEYESIYSQLELVTLKAGQIVYQRDDPIKYVYFPENTCISYIVDMENGISAEVGMVGNEGMLGIPVCLRTNRSSKKAAVQVDGDAWRIRADKLRDLLEEHRGLQTLLLRYIQFFLSQVSQHAACNRLHPLDCRLCKWLLMVRDRVDNEVFYLTHELLSQMLGVRRAGISVAARKLQDEGLIDYARGTITLLNRQGLEDCACECYRIIKEEYDHFYQVKKS
jgi:CRP-like cAMP-binding protein